MRQLQHRVRLCAEHWDEKRVVRTCAALFRQEMGSRYLLRLWWLSPHPPALLLKETGCNSLVTVKQGKWKLSLCFHFPLNEAINRPSPCRRGWIRWRPEPGEVKRFPAKLSFLLFAFCFLLSALFPVCFQNF